MKYVPSPPLIRRILTPRVPSAVVMATFLAISGVAHANTYIKANDTDDLDSTFSWTTDIVPTATDIALWNNTVTGANAATTGSGVNFGQIQIANPGGLVTINQGVAGLTLSGVSGVGIDMSSATQNLTINAALTLAGDQQWNVASGRTLTIGGATGFDQGTSNLTLNGLGTVNINPVFGTVANTTATGGITVNRGTLNFNAPASALQTTTTDLISGLTPLTVGGGTVGFVAGARIGPYTQNFSSFTIAAGFSSLTQGRGSNGSVIVQLGTLVRNIGGTANLLPTSNGSGFRTTSADVNGILSGGLTLNGTDFAHATNSTTNISAAVYTNDTWAPANNTTLTVDSTQTDATTNSLRMATAATRVLTLAGTNTITSGGLLVSSAVGAFNKTITGGILQGAAGQGLIVHQNNTGGTLTIASAIADNTSATALTKSGAGTLILSGNNTFTGGIYMNAGTLQIGNAGALNSATPNAVSFTNNSSAILALAGTSTTVSALTTTPLIAGTKPIVQNANATAATLTIDNASDGTFGGNIQDGVGGGALSLTKQGVGTQNLTGTLAYTGTTTVAAGTLAVTNNLSSSLTVNSGATLDVTGVSGGQLLGSGKSLSGSGTILGAMTLGNGSTTTPGGSGAIGALTINTLNLNSGSTVNFEFGVGNDQFNVSTALTIGSYASGGFNLLTTGGGQLTTTGVTYTLFDYTGALLTGFSNLSSSLILNPVGGLTYTFGNDTVNNRVTLTLSGAIAVSSNWIQDAATGNWSSSANWSGGVIPSGATETANFVATTPNNPAHTVTLDSNRTVGAITLDSATGYTISGSSTLSLDNGANNASISVNNGSHTISTAVNLISTTSVSVANAIDALTISGNISGSPAGGLIKGGAGMLVLSGTNTYSGGTQITGGTVKFAGLGNLGTDGITLAGGTLLFDAGNTADISSRTITLGIGGGKFDVGANDVAFANPIGNNGAGGPTKTGTGKLSLVAGNTYTGANVLLQGTLNIADDTSLGAVPVSAATNLTFNPGAANFATLQASGTVALNVNRNVVLSTGTAIFDTNGNSISIAGVLSGTGNLQKNGLGTLTLTGTNTATGNVVLNAGNIAINNLTNLPTGSITFNGTSGINIGNVNAAFNNVTVNGDNFIAKTGNGNVLTLGGATTGAGTLTLTQPYVTDLTGDFTNFTGTIVANGDGVGGGTLRFNGTAGSTSLSLTLNAFANVRNGATAITLGALNGTGNLSGSNSGGQVVTYTIGGKTLSGVPVDSAFSGIISDGVTVANLTAITKVGNSTLTLSGASTYTGATNVNGGKLEVTGSLSATSLVTVGAAGTLSGTGTIGAVNVNGIVAPGSNGIGTIHTGSFNITGTGSLNAELGSVGLTPVSDQVNLATGLVSLTSGANLQLTLSGGMTASVGDIYYLIVNQDIDAVNGTFTKFNGVAMDLSEGASFTYNNLQFNISYQADSGASSFSGGNDVALRVAAVPEPGTIALLIGGMGMLVLFRRRRRAV